MKVKVKTDISLADEPCLATLDSVSYIKQYIEYDESNNDDIAMYKSMCVAARKVIERETGRALGEQTMQVLIDDDDLCENKFVLPFIPHKKYVANEFIVKSVNYAGTETALTKDTGYYLWGNAVNSLTIEIPTVLSTSVGVTGLADQYLIEYICGYGISGANGTEDLPENLRFAMLDLVCEWWDNRKNYIPVVTANSSVWTKITPYMVDRL